ncbi:hypothetical protein CC2G_001500 [Coprinopsis cinerea AmutBmut pab1-1]|nr:hypothetical protein CC2G_001500 [Coprinopsis cinerea AmutBmut pab1-1]
MAEELNERGRKAYLRGDFASARELYEKAALTDGELGGIEPKYFSNLSAAFFELGEYENCTKAIEKSWAILQTAATPLECNPLAARLATRYAKAYCFMNTAAHIKVDDTIKEFVKSHPDSDQGAMMEARAWWNLLNERRARNTGVFKTIHLPTMDFFRFGTDRIQSLIDGRRQHDPLTEMRQRDLDSVEKDQLAFLFGGSGDARHVFGTILHAANLGWTNQWHMTLVEIHPATVAKTLVIFELLWMIGQATNEEEKDEIFATLIFMYTTFLLPDYCVDRLIKTSAAVEKRLSSAKGSGPIALYSHLSVARSSMPTIIAVLKQWSTPLGKTAAGMIKYNPHIRRVSKAEEWLMLLGETDANELRELEQQVLQTTKALFPPETLIQRHPAIHKAYTTKRLTSSIIRDIKIEVLERWKPNFLIFRYEDTCGARLLNLGDGYPSTQQNAHDELLDYYTIEVVLEDVILGLPRIIADPRRPKTYPTKFTRMWLSNIPDYTGGPLNNIIFLVPHLHRSKSNMLMFNKLINTGLFSTVADVTYNYTLLEEKDLRQFLGCRHVDSMSQGSVWGWIALVADTDKMLKVSARPSQAELHDWLALLLLSTVKSAHSERGSYRVDQPNNLAVVVHLLIYLHDFMGIPGGWLADFVGAVSENRLVTAARPYCGFLPIPVSHAKNRKPRAEKVNLRPWLNDFQLALSDLAPLIRFPIHHIIPENFILEPKDIVHIKTRVMDRGAFIPPYFGDHVLRPVLGFAFYKLNKGVDIAAVLKDEGLMKVIQSGEEEVAKKFGGLQIMLSQGNVEVIEDECRDWERGDPRLFPPSFVSWRMARAEYERMRSEGWKMMLYRTDSSIIISTTAEAAEWFVATDA